LAVHRPLLARGDPVLEHALDAHQGRARVLVFGPGSGKGSVGLMGSVQQRAIIDARHHLPGRDRIALPHLHAEKTTTDLGATWASRAGSGATVREPRCCPSPLPVARLRTSPTSALH